MSKFGIHCPVCDTKWTETPQITGDTWYDCLKCEKTAEAITKEQKEVQDKKDKDYNYGYGSVTSKKDAPLTDDEEVQQWLDGIFI